MAFINYYDIAITGLSAAVPQYTIDNSTYSDFFSDKERKSIIKMTGIRHRRFSGSDICASDLFYAAAKSFLN
jgi:3-oxoacyl-[acyl-carrier-protein] synthase III